MLTVFSLTRADLAELAAGAEVVATGFQAGAEFCRGFGVDPDSEDADLTLTWLAMLESLRRERPTLVAVGDAPAQASQDLGQIEAAISLASVSAFFVLESLVGVKPLVGASLAEAWGSEITAQLLAESDLLWFGVSELAPALAYLDR